MDTETKRALKSALKKSKWAKGKALGKKERAQVCEGVLTLKTLKENKISKTFGTYKIGNIVKGKADYDHNETKKRSKWDTKTAGISTVLQGFGFARDGKQVNE